MYVWLRGRGREESEESVDKQKKKDRASESQYDGQEGYDRVRQSKEK